MVNKSSNNPGQTDTESLPKMNDKQLAYQMLRQSNVPPQKASKAVGYHPSYGYHLDKKLQKYSLKTKKMVNLAHKAVKETLEMKPLEIEHERVLKTGEVVKRKEKILPSHTNRLTAAQMIYDRIEPIVRDEQLQDTNITVQLINFSEKDCIQRGDDDGRHSRLKPEK